jgi:damage-control phosphatase, subfamily I
MNTTLNCIPCFVRQTLDASRTVTDDPAVHEQVVRDVLRWMSEMDMSLSPPALAQRIHRRLRELTGIADPYRKEKDQHNQMALALLPGLRAQVAASDDPLMTAANLAIAGNIIDLGAKSGLAETDVHEALLHAAEKPLEGDCEIFRKEVAQAKTILYLADNCGEIVFDTLLIEQLGPQRVTLAVRGMPIINDATLEDAVTAGLDQIVPILGNGSDAPGTVLDDCSDEFKNAFESADLIVSKGQGNFETLSDCGKNIFFLLKFKCPVVAESVGLPVGSHVLRHGRNFN